MARRSPSRKRRRRPALEPTPTYPDLSRQPLHILIFLTPLILYYEIGAITTGTPDEVKAHRQFSNLFEVMGVTAVYLPGILLVVVLLLWHIMERHAWRVRPGVVLGMAAESVAWTLPFWLLGQIISGVGSARQPAGTGAALASGAHEAPYVVLVGAGVYEEMLFRLVGIAAVHLIAVDLFGIADRHGRVIAVVVTALLFGLYHESRLESAATSAEYVGYLTYYFLMGAYLGALYLARGLGIVVAVHALYNVLIKALA